MKPAWQASGMTPRFIGIVLFFVCLFGGLGQFSPNAYSESSSQDSQVRGAHEARRAMENLDPAGAAREMEAFARSLTNQMQSLLEKQAASQRGSVGEVFLVVIGILLLGVVCILRYVPRFMTVVNDRTEARMSGATAAAELSASLLAEEESFNQFAAKFRIGPIKTSAERSPASVSTATPAVSVGRHAPAVSAPPQSAPTVAAPRTTPATPFVPPPPPAPKRDLLKEFFELSPQKLAELHKLLGEVSAASDTPAAQKVLCKLGQQITDLKAIAGLPEVLPVWQMTTALEALIKQLTDKGRNITPSTLRTVVGSVDLLDALCVPGVKPNLTSDPVLKLLGVDDDPLSRHAVSFALKKALNQPD